MTRNEKETCVHEARALIAGILGIVQGIPDTGLAHLASLKLSQLDEKIDMLTTEKQEMTLADIKNRVEYIREISGDDEAAHSEEDTLQRLFIAYIAEFGPSELSDMAKEVLTTETIDFERWFA